MRKVFPKSERIVSKKLIDELFTSGRGHSLTAFPLRAVFIERDGRPEAEPPVALLLSVPKRKFKHAVDRNHVKRQLREAFRNNKHLLASSVPAGKQVALAFVWLSDRHLPTADVAARVGKLLGKLETTLLASPKNV